MGLVTTFLPSFLLSGFLYAIENMPMPIQVITHVVPARYFVTIVRGIFLKGIGLNVLWGEVLFLVAFSGMVFWVAEREDETEAGLRCRYERTHFSHRSKRAEPDVPQPAHALVSVRTAHVSAHHLRLCG